MQFFPVYVMKLEDIKKAVVNAAESEFKRAFYNAAAVISNPDLRSLFYSLCHEVYDPDTAGED